MGVNKRIPVKGWGGGRAVGWRPWYLGAEAVVGCATSLILYSVSHAGCRCCLAWETEYKRGGVKYFNLNHP